MEHRQLLQGDSDGARRIDYEQFGGVEILQYEDFDVTIQNRDTDTGMVLSREMAGKLAAVYPTEKNVVLGIHGHDTVYWLIPDADAGEYVLSRKRGVDEEATESVRLSGSEMDDIVAYLIDRGYDALGGARQ